MNKEAKILWNLETQRTSIFPLLYNAQVISVVGWNKPGKLFVFFFFTNSNKEAILPIFKLWMLFFFFFLSFFFF